MLWILTNSFLYLLFNVLHELYPKLFELHSDDEWYQEYFVSLRNVELIVVKVNQKLGQGKSILNFLQQRAHILSSLIISHFEVDSLLFIVHLLNFILFVDEHVFGDEVFLLFIVNVDEGWKNIGQSNKLFNLGFCLVPLVSNDFIELKKVIVFLRKVKKLHDSKFDFLDVVIDFKVGYQILFSGQVYLRLQFLKLNNGLYLNDFRHHCPFAQTWTSHKTQKGELGVFGDQIVFFVMKSGVYEIEQKIQESFLQFYVNRNQSKELPSLYLISLYCTVGLFDELEDEFGSEGWRSFINQSQYF